MKVWPWGAVPLLVAAIAIAGCGGEGEVSAGTQAATGSPPDSGRPLRDLEVTLDGYAGPENLGILVADREGYFRDAGLEVTVYSPALPARPIEYTMGSNIDVGISREPEVALAQSRGTPVVAFGSLVDEPTAAIIWLAKSGIDGIADLRGKTIAIPGLRFQGRFLRSVLAGAGLSMADVKVEAVGYDLVQALVKGRADAIFGGSWNLEGVQLKALGLAPVVTRVQSLGVPPYDEFVAVAPRHHLARDPELFRDFMEAAVRGAAKAIEDPDLALETIEEALEADPRVSRRARKAQVEATLPLLSGAGYMDPARAGRLLDWMREERLIQGPLPVSSLLTDDLLPQP
jgi:ABC-type nitrate/sulfonate/bicarbonate transport system substrate-binding protein